MCNAQSVMAVRRTRRNSVGRNLEEDMAFYKNNTSSLVKDMEMACSPNLVVQIISLNTANLFKNIYVYVRCLYDTYNSK